MTIVMDTSSVISLEMAGVLRKSIRIINVIIPKAVENELKEIEKYRDTEGKAARNVLSLIKNKAIGVVEIKNARKTDKLLSKDVNLGDAECFVCCLEKNIRTLVMDDIDAAYNLEGLAIANGIKIKISVAVLIELYRQKIISKAELKKSIRNMIKIREWEGGVLEVLAKKYLENIIIS